METILEIKNLTKTYDDFTVLNDLSLTVHKGEVLVIVGPSGCGKSTLLRCLNGLENINDGTITLENKPILQNRKSLRKTREEIGMVFQSYDLFPT